MSLANEILANWAPVFKSVRLEPAERGRFEVALDGELVFSKSSLGRHAQKGEVVRLFEQRLGRSLHWR